MKLLLFGNSHLGALKYALDEHPISNRPDLDIVFWGVHGRYFPDITFNDGVLRSPKADYSYMLSDNRYRELPIDEFDVMVFYAGSLDLSAEARNFSNRIGDPVRFSHSFIREATVARAGEWIRSRPVWPIMEAVRAWRPQLRGLVCPQALHATSRAAEFKQPDLARTVLPLLEEGAKAACAGLDLEYLPQPAETIEQGLMTKAEFTVGSMKLNTNRVKHPNGDGIHMNAAYGGLSLSAIDERLFSSAD